MKYLNLPMELKGLDDAGAFSGYAAIFGNVDLGGDVIERGAFKEIVKNKNGHVTMLWQHSQRDPIGVAAVHQDDKGLAFEGRLVLEDPTARKAYAHLKAGSVNGMSIGFETIKSKVTDAGIRLLQELRLFEISPVTFAMNPLAGVDAVKSMPQFSTIRECEAWLRDELGLTHGAAKDFVVRFKAALLGARDEPARDEPSLASAEAELVAALRSVGGL